MKIKGVFVCIEGLDGCGKTTQAKVLVRRLKRKGFDTVYTAEPSRGKIGQFIKKRLLNCESRASGVVEALLFAADRVEHIENEIVPALQAGKVVVSDRYLYSSLAYQGATGLDLEWIGKINEHALHPDLAILIDVDPEMVVHRLKARKSVMENMETQKKVREVYRRFVRRRELVMIDGGRSKEDVANDVLQVVIRFLTRSC